MGKTKPTTPFPLTEVLIGVMAVVTISLTVALLAFINTNEARRYTDLVEPI
jgi:hypothetical protein